MTDNDATAGESKQVEYSAGRRVRSTREFSGVPKGTEGVVDEDYGEGLMVAWDLPDRPLPEGYDRLPADVLWPTTTGPDGFEIPLLRDGFDKATEMRFLERIEDDEDEAVTDGGRDEPLVDVNIRCGRGDVMPLAALLMTGGLVVGKQQDEPMMAELGEHLSDEILAGLAGGIGEADNPLAAYLQGVNELADVDPSRGPPPERFDVQVVDVDEDGSA